MEEDFFDVAIEGTTIKDWHEVDEDSRKIVIDRESNYGSTYSSLDKLAKSRYIADLRVLQAPSDRVTVEALPFLLRPGSPAVKTYSRKPFGGSLEYVDINTVLFVDSKAGAVRLPKSKTDIVEMDCFTNTDRFYMYTAIKTGDIGAFKKHLIRDRKEDDILYKAFVTYNLFTNASLPAFGTSLYIYPVYGSSEISENISMVNSLKGYSYLLNRHIEMSEVDHNGYRYRFECEFGTLYTKQLVRQALRKKSYWVRVLRLDAPLHGGNFLAYLESAEIIRIIGLDSRTKTCPDGTQMLYFIKAGGPTTQAEIDAFIGPGAAIHVDLSFRTVFDPDQFQMC